jgi:hypothetical protein
MTDAKQMMPRRQRRPSKLDETPAIQTPPTPEPAERSPLAAYTGSDDSRFTRALIQSAMGATWSGGGNETVEHRDQRIAAVFSGLRAFAPKDEIEAMLAAQADGLHHATMECLRRAMIPEQPTEAATRLRRDAANMARTMAEMVDALDRKRGKGPQVVRVERVVVHEGGQAIVGNVASGTGQGGGA